MRGSGFATRWLMRAFLCMSPLILAVEPAAGQQFFEEITVEEIEIPVHVVRKGRSVAGLKREDFQVFVDGEPVEIVGFNVLERHATGEPEAPEAVQEPAVTPTVSTRPQHFLLLFDFLYAEPLDLMRMRALRGAREMTSRQLDPQDRVALAFLTGSGATVLVGFTRDRKELELGLDVIEAMLKRKAGEVPAAIARLQRHVGGEAGDAEELAELSRRFGATAALAFGNRLGTGVNLGSLASGIESRTFDPTLDIDFVDGAGGPTRFPEDEQPSGSDPVNRSLAVGAPEEIAAVLAQSLAGSGVRFLALEIERLATLLRDVPTPKEILFLSRGFPTSMLASARVLRYLREMNEALLGGGWVLHGIDLAGIPAAGPGVEARAPGGPATNQLGFGADALFYMANETGGQIIENYNRMDRATHALLRRTRVTYLLTIWPDPLPADGRRHRIEVKLKERKWGTRVDHRPAYYAQRSDKSSNPLEAELQEVRELQRMREWLGDEEDNPLAAVVHAGRVREVDSANRVRLLMEIPGSVITGERTAGIARLEVRTYVLDSAGGVQSTWARRVSLNLAEVGHRLRDRRLCLRTELEVPPGPHRLRTVVRMPERNARSLLTSPIAESWRGLPSDAREECLEPLLR